MKKINQILIAIVLFISAACASQKASPVTATKQIKTDPSAPKAERAVLEGKWRFTLQGVNQQTIPGTLLIQKGGATSYSGRITIAKYSLDAETAITKAELKGQDIIYEGNIKSSQGLFPFKITGTIQGDKLQGQSSVQLPDGNQMYKFEATRL